MYCRAKSEPNDKASTVEMRARLGQILKRRTTCRVFIRSRLARHMIYTGVSTMPEESRRMSSEISRLHASVISVRIIASLSGIGKTSRADVIVDRKGLAAAHEAPGRLWRSMYSTVQIPGGTAQLPRPGFDAPDVVVLMPMERQMRWRRQFARRLASDPWLLHRPRQAGYLYQPRVLHCTLVELRSTCNGRQLGTACRLDRTREPPAALLRLRRARFQKLSHILETFL